MRSLLKEAVRRVGVRVTWWRPANRFDAMRDALELLRDQGFDPRVVIDAGANVGNWSRLARLVFPRARYELIEPQPACQPQLRAAAAAIGSATIHPVAVTSPGHSRVGLVGGTGSGSTGVSVVEPADATDPELDCPATTLDALFARNVGPNDRALLKLDLESHEVAALRGAAELLRVTEVVVAEAQVYEIERNGRPVFRDLVNVLSESGFEFYDVAAASPRQRDGRLQMVDVVFVRSSSLLSGDLAWS